MQKASYFSFFVIFRLHAFFHVGLKLPSLASGHLMIQHWGCTNCISWEVGVVCLNWSHFISYVVHLQLVLTFKHSKNLLKQGTDSTLHLTRFWRIYNLQFIFSFSDDSFHRWNRKTAFYIIFPWLFTKVDNVSIGKLITALGSHDEFPLCCCLGTVTPAQKNCNLCDLWGQHILLSWHHVLLPDISPACFALVALMPFPLSIDSDFISLHIEATHACMPIWAFKFNNLNENCVQ